MKKFLQLVALVVIAMLAAQPAMGGLNCAMGATASPCATGCPMAMGQMGMDCQMPAQIAGQNCLQDCCSHALPPVVAQVAAGAKPKTIAAQVIAIAPQDQLAGQMAFVASPRGLLDSSGPPRYILHQVFRI